MEGYSESCAVEGIKARLDIENDFGGVSLNILEYCTTVALL